MTQPNIAEIARSLTKTQREAVSAAQTVAGASGAGERLRCLEAGRVRAALVDKRLAYLAVPMFAWRSNRRDVILTPLGLLVRQHLLTEGEGA